jgi:hypothetical protein
MTTLASPATTSTDSTWLRRTHLGLALGILGVLAMAVGMLMTRNEHQPEGYTYQGIGDYILTVSALPQGVGLFLATLGFHRLQHGRDGRLGTVGVWIYGLCLLELVIQGMTGVVLGYETIWGPAYPLCSLGLLVGLALLAAGSWNVGLLPRWMLAVWPPLGVIGSFFGLGPIPFVFAVFLVALGVTLQRRVGSSTAE